MPALNRRDFLTAAAVTASAIALGKPVFAAEPAQESLRWPVCTFVKYLQTLSFEELARSISDMGFQGIEATVRTAGQILPDEATDKLPQLVEALKAHQLEVTIMASSINRADGPWAEEVLRIASKLGIKRYRMDYYRYDLKKPVAPQLRELKAVAKDLAALNQDLGIQGIYQNHAGANYVGATLWDLHFLLEDIPREQIGIAYDTQHTAVECGQSWPTVWNLVQPHLAAIYVKNARWIGRKPEGIPLGDEGVVDPRIFKMIKDSNFQGPISLHVEYLPKGNIAENLAAIRQDFGSLKDSL